jgi:apolipoprotein N-acyltransferase
MLNTYILEKIKGVLLALFSALLLTLSFPKFDLEIIAWFALVPLLLAIRVESYRSTFVLSLFAGPPFFMGVFYWMNIVHGFTWKEYLLLGTYLGSYFAFFGLLFNFTSKKVNLSPIVIGPAIWISMEYLRSHAGFLACPWALLGHSQHLNTPVIQISSFAGAYGLSFIIVMTNVALAELIQSRFRNFKPVMIALLVLVLSHAYGFYVLTKGAAGDRINITLIQGNIPVNKRLTKEFRKRIIDKHAELTKDSQKESHASLIVWPEGAVVRIIDRDPYFFGTLVRLAKENNAYVLAGSTRNPKLGAAKKFRKKGKYYNSAFLVSSDGKFAGQHNKIRLLPFGEYLPYAESFPWPKRYTETYNYTPGTEYKIFAVDDVAFGVTICWENIFPDLFRRFVRNGADFMINMTNEAWFGETAAPYQFLSMSVFRAVENRIWVVRSSNSGISGFIDPYGRVIAKVVNNGKDIFVEGHVSKEIPVSQGNTFYTMYGDIFAYINLILTLFMITISFLKRDTVRV